MAELNKKTVKLYWTRKKTFFFMAAENLVFTQVNQENVHEPCGLRIVTEITSCHFPVDEQIKEWLLSVYLPSCFVFFLNCSICRGTIFGKVYESHMNVNLKEMGTTDR